LELGLSIIVIMVGIGFCTIHNFGVVSDHFSLQLSVRFLFSCKELYRLFHRFGRSYRNCYISDYVKNETERTHLFGVSNFVVRTAARCRPPDADSPLNRELFV
jgi:hypothetical protein